MHHDETDSGSTTNAYHFLIGNPIEPFSEDRDDEDIDNEGGEEGDARLDEEILIGLLHLLLLAAVYLT